jgi:hypothetical protein
VKVHVPLPLQVVVDDVGWWSGDDGHARNEPFRSGLGRTHVPADYAVLVSLGRQLGIRPLAAMILCEWDRDNLLRRVPTATWQGAQWDNRRRVGPWLDEAAEILRQGAEHVELALHGVGHEYWDGGPFTRAEWHDMAGNMRPAAEVTAHLEAFEALLERNGLGAFPRAFVPAAFLHAMGDGPRGLAAILHAWGVRRISTPCAFVREGFPFAHPLFGMDEGVMTVLAPGAYPYPWNQVAAAPAHEVTGPVLGLHWPNLLHAEPERNEETVARWVAFLRGYDQRPDRMLAPDCETAWAQLAHHGLARLTQDAEGLALDVSAVLALGLPGGECLRLRFEGAAAPGLRWEGATELGWRRVGAQCHEVRLRVTAADGRVRATWEA